jgi:hypothetical protein
MPWKIIKLEKDKYQLEKLEDGTRPNKIFKSRESAISMGKRWMQYRKETNIRVVGNKILGTKLSDIKKKDKKK